MPKWSGKWLGGRTYTANDGRTRWIIRKTVAGAAYNITLDVRSEAEALAELAVFRHNPVEHIQKLYAALGSQAIRDVLCLQA
jgi:hypothetical protein